MAWETNVAWQDYLGKLRARAFSGEMVDAEFAGDDGFPWLLSLWRVGPKWHLSAQLKAPCWKGGVSETWSWLDRAVHVLSNGNAKSPIGGMSVDYCAPMRWTWIEVPKAKIGETDPEIFAEEVGYSFPFTNFWRTMDGLPREGLPEYHGHDHDESFEKLQAQEECLVSGGDWRDQRNRLVVDALDMIRQMLEQVEMLPPYVANAINEGGELLTFRDQLRRSGENVALLWGKVKSRFDYMKSHV